MHIDPQTKILIEDLTQDIIKEYGLEIPVTEINDIVAKIGGVVTFDFKLGKYSTPRVKKINAHIFEICVSPYTPEPLKNVMIATELGHVFLHMGYEIDTQLWEQQSTKSCFKENEQTKKEAYAFGIALLMPKDEYKQVMNAHTSNGRVDMKDIAKHFNVTVNAAADRGRYLEYIK